MFPSPALRSYGTVTSPLKLFFSFSSLPIPPTKSRPTSGKRLSSGALYKLPSMFLPRPPVIQPFPRQLRRRIISLLLVYFLLICIRSGFRKVLNQNPPRPTSPVHELHSWKFCELLAGLIQPLQFRENVPRSAVCQQQDRSLHP